jgi:hypothetical protein
MAVILNGATGGIQLTSASGGTMSVNPPATATSYVSTLPAATGTLLNSVSSLPAANLTGTVPTARLGSGTASSSTFLRGDSTYAEAGGGKIAQIVTATKTDSFSFTNFPAFVDCPGLSVTITPAATSSKIYVMLSISGGGMEGYRYKLVRGSTAISIGTGSIGSRTAATGQASNRNYDEVDSGCANFLDSPSTTSATTYKVQVSTGNSSTDSKINATRNDPDSSYGIRTASTITVMEVSA